MSELIPDPLDPSVYFIASASEAVLGIAVGEATLVNVHDADKCAGRHCLVHNPSDHHMRGWPLHWRDDKGVMERICPHGIGHPDPDSAEFLESVGLGALGVHGCDGCCRR